MTLRARPISRRPGRAGWDSGDRRTFLINASFIGAIVLAILILVGYAGFSWYQNHLGAAATINGQTITMDQLRAQYAVEKFRVDYRAARIRDLFAAGHISQDSETQALSFLDQTRSSLGSIALGHLVDYALQGQLAPQEAIQPVTDADVDAQLLVEATTSEERHVWSIEVTPAVDPASGQVGESQKDAAKAKALAALEDLKAGKSWDDVAKVVSTATSAPQAGDLGWLPQKDTGYEQPFMDAVFKLSQGGVTDLIEGGDGTFRIGHVTDISPQSVDGALQTKIEQAGVSLADYRSAVRGDVIQQRLQDKVVADLSAPGKQRHVLQIYLQSAQVAPNSVKVRHILFSPNHDPTAASNVKASDPAWAKARADAESTYLQVARDPSKFDQLARTLSDDTGSKADGGKLPYYDPTSAIDPAFETAIFAPNLHPGDILEPFKTNFGWEVVQYMRPYGDGEAAWMDTLKTKIAGGADFAQLARDQGEGAEAAKGGDLGWIAMGQLGDAKESPIFGTAVGSLSDVVPIQNDGVYLWKVVAEETRTPDASQVAIFQQSGFSTWYSLKKGQATISQNDAAAAVLSG